MMSWAKTQDLWSRITAVACLAWFWVVLLPTTSVHAAEVRVMTLGDSIVTGGDGNFRTPLKAFLAADGYAIEYIGIGRDADGNRHEGHGGWTPEMVRLVLGTTYTADVYVVYAGLNGLTDASLKPVSDGVGTHVLAMRAVLDAIYSYMPTARVVLARIGLVRDVDSPVNPRIIEYNRQLSLMVRAYGHADRLWLADAQNIFHHDPANYVDGVHPSQKGFDILAAALHPAVLHAAQSAVPRAFITVRRLAWGLAVLAFGGAAGVLWRRWRRG